MNRDAQLSVLEGYVGFHEGPNNDNPFGPWQGVAHAAWCDSFAQYGACQAGDYRWPDRCQFGWRGDAYCPYTEQHATELGLWVPLADPRAANPLPGWQYLCDWNHNGVADHIGTVVRVVRPGPGLRIIGVEGNYQDSVQYVVRDETYLLGFVALPVNQAVPQPPPQQPQPGQGDDLNVNWPLFTVKRGSSGQVVKNLQGLLCAAGRTTAIDGDFGQDTEAKLKDWQQAANVPGGADGVCGENTWRWLLGWHS